MTKAREERQLEGSKLRHVLKSIYMAVPLKKQVFSGIREVWVPPEKVSRYLYFRGVFTVQMGDRQFKINHYGFPVETSIFWYGLTGGWERVSLSAWIKLCLQARVIFDIGANTGVYSLVAKAVNPASKVHGFEPIKRVFEKLVANNDLNQYDIDCRELAVSNYDGEGIMYDLPTEHIYCVTLNRNTHSKQVAPIALPTAVKTTRLDTFIKSVGLAHLDLIKIDVESHEPEVLEGLGECLASKPTMLLEVWNNDVGQRVEQILRRQDYLFFATDEIQPFSHREHIENPDPEKGYLSYLICAPETAAGLGLQ